MTFHESSAIRTRVSTLHDYLTILVNVVEQLEQAGDVTDCMVATLRTAVQACVSGVAEIQETARPA
jgi:acetylglutamate kinase